MNEQRVLAPTPIKPIDPNISTPKNTLTMLKELVAELECIPPSLRRHLLALINKAMLESNAQV